MCPKKCRCCFKKRTKKPPIRPILLITDIGRDIDDTLALILLNTFRKQNKIKIVGIVTTGVNGKTRGRVVRRWLNHFELPTGERKLLRNIPIAACGTNLEHSECSECSECYVPDDAPLLKNALLSKLSPAQLILEATQSNMGKLEIFAIGPLTPLSDALHMKGGLDILKSGIKILHIQGQLKMDTGNQSLILPDLQSYNLSKDPKASHHVFTLLQESVPFRMLGKYAAYQIDLNKTNFTEWNNNNNNNNSADNNIKNELLKEVKHVLNAFRTSDAEKFYELYPVPMKHRTDTDWFENMTTLSHPYDPLCILAAFHPKLFRSKQIKGTHHRTIGNTKEENGVVNPMETKQRLVQLIGHGIKE